MRSTPFEAVKINYELIFETIEIIKEEPTIKLADTLLKMVNNLKLSLDLDEEVGMLLLAFYDGATYSITEAKYKLVRNKPNEALSKIKEIEETLHIVYDGINGLEDNTTSSYNPHYSVVSYNKEGGLNEYSESKHDFKI